jgi:hypothetical protein
VEQQPTTAGNAGYPITVGVAYPEKLSRLTTFFRIFMIIPQAIVLYFINIAASVILFISWWAILFTGKYPKGLFDFIAGTLRWTTRVNGYSYLLTDKYPPFSLS